MYYFRMERSIIYQKPSETVVLGGCEHIDNYDCITRKIPFYDYNNMKIKLLEICNEKLKLLTHDEFLNGENTNGFKYLSYQDAMVNVIFKLIYNNYSNQYLLEGSLFGNHKLTFNPVVNIAFILRPFIYAGIKYKDAIDLLCRHSEEWHNNNTYSDDNPYGHLKISIERATHGIIEHVLKHVKYKKYHEGAKRLTNEMKYSYNYNKWIFALNDFMASLLEKYQK